MSPIEEVSICEGTMLQFRKVTGCQSRVKKGSYMYDELSIKMINPLCCFLTLIEINTQAPASNVVIVLRLRQVILIRSLPWRSHNANLLRFPSFFLHERRHRLGFLINQRVNFQMSCHFQFFTFWQFRMRQKPSLLLSAFLLLSTLLSKLLQSM